MMFFRDKRDESHRRKVKHHFHEGRLYGTTLEILYVHDLTDMINFRDATYLYDVRDRKTNTIYNGLTYKEVVRLIKHQPVNRKIVFFLTQDMIDKLRYGYCVEDDRELDILSNRRKVPSKMELSLVYFAESYLVPEEERLDDDTEMYNMALDSLDFIISQSESLLDEDAKAYFKMHEESKKKRRVLKQHKVGDIIIGRFTSFRIINRLGHDTHRKARYDIEDMKTKKRYYYLTIGDIKRMANADYPIIEVDGVELRLSDWAKKLGIKSTTLRQYYRRHNYDTDAVAKLIKSHLNKLDKDDENND